jgi:hypothetical protein
MPEPTGNLEQELSQGSGSQEIIEEDFVVTHNDAWGHGPVLKDTTDGQTIPTPGEDGKGRSVSATD